MIGITTQGTIVASMLMEGKETKIILFEVNFPNLSLTCVHGVLSAEGRE